MKFNGTAWLFPIDFRLFWVLNLHKLLYLVDQNTPRTFAQKL